MTATNMIYRGIDVMDCVRNNACTTNVHDTMRNSFLCLDVLDSLFFLNISNTLYKKYPISITPKIPYLAAAASKIPVCDSTP